MAKTSDGKSIIGSGGPKRSLPKLTKKTVIICSIVLILAVAGGLSYFLLRPKQTNVQPKIQPSSACSDKAAGSLLKDVVPLLDPTKHSELASSVEKIQKLEAYDRDPNCLYILAVNAVDGGKNSEARKYIEKAKQIDYDGNLAPNLTTFRGNFETLESTLKGQEQAETTGRKNFIGTGETDGKPVE